MSTYLQIEFRTDKFILTGDLPETINAGNRMYGEDLGTWLAGQLPEWDLDCADEDWGWLLSSGEVVDQNTPNRKVCHEIGIYAYPDEAQHADGSNLGDWMLNLSQREIQQVTILGLFKRKKFVHIDYDPRLAQKIVEVLTNHGVSAVKTSKCEN